MCLGISNSQDIERWCCYLSLEMGGTVQHVESHRKAPELTRRQRGGGSRTDAEPLLGSIEERMVKTGQVQGVILGLGSQ